MRLIRFVVNVTVVLFDCRNMGYFYLKLPLLKYNERYLENQIEDWMLYPYVDTKWWEKNPKIMKMNVVLHDCEKNCNKEL